MKLLKLVGLHIGPYKGVFVGKEFKENTMNAYIYDTKMIKGQVQACDAAGNCLGTFMNNDDRLKLEAHIVTNIIPVIAGGLKGTKYFVQGVDYTNQAPHPHLVIARHDSLPLTKVDEAAIREKLESTILAANQVRVKQSDTKKCARILVSMHQKGMLNTVGAEQEASKQDQPTHHYNLRPRH